MYKDDREWAEGERDCRWSSLSNVLDVRRPLNDVTYTPHCALKPDQEHDQPTNQPGSQPGRQTEWENGQAIHLVSSLCFLFPSSSNNHLHHHHHRHHHHVDRCCDAYKPQIGCDIKLSVQSAYKFLFNLKYSANREADTERENEWESWKESKANNVGGMSFILWWFWVLYREKQQLSVKRRERRNMSPRLIYSSFFDKY